MEERAQPVLASHHASFRGPWNPVPPSVRCLGPQDECMGRLRVRHGDFQVEIPALVQAVIELTWEVL